MSPEAGKRPPETRSTTKNTEFRVVFGLILIENGENTLRFLGRYKIRHLCRASLSYPQTTRVTHPAEPWTAIRFWLDRRRCGHYPSKAIATPEPKCSKNGVARKFKKLVSSRGLKPACGQLQGSS